MDVKLVIVRRIKIMMVIVLIWTISIVVVVVVTVSVSVTAFKAFRLIRYYFFKEFMCFLLIQFGYSGEIPIFSLLALALLPP
jgi:hypothetical protein